MRRRVPSAIAIAIFLLAAGHAGASVESDLPEPPRPPPPSTREFVNAFTPPDLTETAEEGANVNREAPAPPRVGVPAFPGEFPTAPTAPGDPHAEPMGVPAPGAVQGPSLLSGNSRLGPAPAASAGACTTPLGSGPLAWTPPCARADPKPDAHLGPRPDAGARERAPGPTSPSGSASSPLGGAPLFVGGSPGAGRLAPLPPPGAHEATTADTREGATPDPGAQRGFAGTLSEWAARAAEWAATRPFSAIAVTLSFLGAIPPLWRLYRRLTREAALANPTRRGVYDAISAAPGATVGALARALAVDRRTILHHVELLREFGLLEVRRVGARLRYYQNGGRFTETEKQVHVALASEKARQVLACLAANPAASLAEVGARVGLPKSTVRWHVERLRALGALAPDGTVPIAARDALVLAP